MVELLKKYAIWITFGVAIIFSILFLTDDDEQDELATDGMQAIIASDAVTASSEAPESETSGQVVIDIKGEVNEPGVYEMSTGDRIHHVIEKAGGFTADADQNQVNLAQRLQDEMIIVIPKEGEEETALFSNEPGGGDEGKVKVNDASAQELETLNGIGPSKAEAIIAYREENGFFQQPEDLLEVSGIGEKTLENLRDQIIIP